MTEEHETGAVPADPAAPESPPVDSTPSSDPVASSDPVTSSDPAAPPAADAPAGPPAAGRARGAHAAAHPGLRERYVARRKRKRAVKAARKHRKAPWWELPALVVLAIAIAILVKTFIIQPFYIPSESMEKTLHGCQGCHGDRILVNKIIYDFRDPHPGDIVVFHAPPGWDDEPISKPPGNPVLRVIRGFGQLIGFVPPDGQVLVKRVIAVGGQTVKGDSAGHVMVSTHGPDGPYRTLREPYVYRSQPGDGDNGHADFGPVTVPKGRLWVMGDHRDDSADSRFHCGPGGGTGDDRACDPVPSTVPIKDVIGKAFVIAWPPSRWRTLGTPPTFTAGFVVPIFAVRRRRRRRG